MHSTNQCFPKSFKAATVDRIHSLQRGMRRKHPKLTHASCKTHKAKSVTPPSNGEMHCAKVYRKTLDHFCT